MLLSELINLKELVGLLRRKLLLIFHLEVISNLLTVLIHVLHVLQPNLEVIEQLLNVRIVSIVQTLDFLLEAKLLSVLGLLKLSELLLLIRQLVLVQILQLLLALVVLNF